MYQRSNEEVFEENFPTNVKNSIFYRREKFGASENSIKTNLFQVIYIEENFIEHKIAFIIPPHKMMMLSCFFESNSIISPHKMRHQKFEKLNSDGINSNFQ